MQLKQVWSVNREDGHAFPEFLDSFDKSFQETGEMVSLGKQCRVFFHSTPEGDFYVKHYFRCLGPGSWLRYSRFEVEVRNLRWFRYQKIPTCDIAAIGTERNGLKLERAVLVTRAIENTMDLARLAQKNPAFKNNRKWRTDILLQVADILRFFHKQRFCHNDFQWRNILVREDTGNTEVFMIDCPFGRKFSWPMLGYRKIKDLGSLDEHARKHISRTERLRFYKHYTGRNKLNGSDKKVIRKMLQRYG
jgi:hypothetical protein